MKNPLRLGALLLAACLLAGCVRVEAPQTVNAWASFYPIYALAAFIARDVPGFTLSCLVQPQDGCLRSYALSDWDAALLAGADLCILGGGGLESFASSLAGGDLAVITLLDNLPLITLDASSGRAEDADHFTGPDPWLFLSVSGARSMAAVLAAALAGLDPDYSRLYQRNLAALDARLAALEDAMAAALEGLERPRAALLQEGLCYLAEELGLEWELLPREAGAEYLDNELDELLARVEATGCRLVLIERQAPQSLVEALEEAGCTVCLLDILSTRSADGGEGYFDAMQQNALRLADALRWLGE